MAVFDGGVTDGRQDGQVPFELLDFYFEAFGHPIRPKTIQERLGEFKHGSPHHVKVIRDSLSIQVKERT